MAQFDRVAGFYRWAEYLALGSSLRRTRERLLPYCTVARKALVLGDGDGRFTAALLQRAPAVQVVAVDTSAKMLELLRKRCAQQGDAQRVEIRHQSALDHHVAAGTDLVATHFFLDCLMQDEVTLLAEKLARDVGDSGIWIVSEFGLPARGLGRWFARAYIRGLYLAFRLLTGLRPQHLPDHGSAMRSAGFVRRVHTRSLGGLLISELWQKRANPVAAERLAQLETASVPST